MSYPNNLDAAPVDVDEAVGTTELELPVEVSDVAPPVTVDRMLDRSLDTLLSALLSDSVNVPLDAVSVVVLPVVSVTELESAEVVVSETGGITVGVPVVPVSVLVAVSVVEDESVADENVTVTVSVPLCAAAARYRELGRAARGRCIGLTRRHEEAEGKQQNSAHVEGK